MHCPSAALLCFMASLSLFSEPVSALPTRRSTSTLSRRAHLAKHERQAKSDAVPPPMMIIPTKVEAVNAADVMERSTLDSTIVSMKRANPAGRMNHKKDPNLHAQLNRAVITGELKGRAKEKAYNIISSQFVSAVDTTDGISPILATADSSPIGTHRSTRQVVFAQELPSSKVVAVTKPSMSQERSTTADHSDHSIASTRDRIGKEAALGSSELEATVDIPDSLSSQMSSGSSSSAPRLSPRTYLAVGADLSGDKSVVPNHPPPSQYVARRQAAAPSPARIQRKKRSSEQGQRRGNHQNRAAVLVNGVWSVI